ncbi:unnamed protein product [Nezara viridula]|uniref:EF-hand domain-containing protein n=1 Tax=Nezara viridula TaxID=85310 RepID=A0A9P0E5K8_NEZVI|nr:unnamed protein product [Nezara viridula]
MTPKDFLESFIHEEPIPVRERRDLPIKELEGIRKSTPPLTSGSSHLFRNLQDKGIISYTEYLFLISILTKPLSGFRIAFNMFDTDGNERVDKNEFLVLQRIFGKRRIDDEEEKLFMEKIFSHAWKDKRGLGVAGNMLQVEGSATADYIDDEQGLQRRHNVDTTLAVHFFGLKGNQDLKYEGFRKFMDDLQTEVLEIEFQEYAKGKNTISELDFAKILLRYTHLSAEVHEQYLERLLTRVKDSMKGITFEEFKVFCQFLNNLEDFTIAMRMYTLADHPISKADIDKINTASMGDLKSNTYGYLNLAWSICSLLVCALYNPYQSCKYCRSGKPPGHVMLPFSFGVALLSQHVISLSLAKFPFLPCLVVQVSVTSN